MRPSHLSFRRLFLAAAAVAGIALVPALIAPLGATEQAVIIPAPKVDVKAADGMQTAIIAGGCFWGVQGVYQHTKGVTNAVSGYSGGSKSTADYRLVSTGGTGHAEAVEITYDPKQISYGKILQIFFSVAHDPTQLDRQGPDTGTQYRSEIFATSDEQKQVADAYIAQLNAAKVFRKPIVTKTGVSKEFYQAEAYHQDYLTLHPNQPYIAFNDLPKIENLKKVFTGEFREKPVLVSSPKMTTN